jgi:hypothetical protein
VVGGISSGNLCRSGSDCGRHRQILPHGIRTRDGLEVRPELLEPALLGRVGRGGEALIVE